MNTPLCIHLLKAPCRFHFNAVLQVVSIVTFCHKNRLTIYSCSTIDSCWSLFISLRFTANATHSPA